KLSCAAFYVFAIIRNLQGFDDKRTFSCIFILPLFAISGLQSSTYSVFKGRLVNDLIDGRQNVFYPRNPDKIVQNSACGNLCR
ncbi:MAG: hypothetical protein ACRD6X_12780, partial [Pyrinomonadaceae bacterium]